MVIYEPESKRHQTLNLKTFSVREQVLKVSNAAHLQALFDVVGT